MGETEKKEKEQGRIVRFFKGVKAEFGKVIWPTKALLWKQTVAVFTIAVILCCFIKLYDVVVEYGIGFLR